MCIRMANIHDVNTGITCMAVPKALLHASDACRQHEKAILVQRNLLSDNY